jgi:hypothetical protein
MLQKRFKASASDLIAYFSAALPTTSLASRLRSTGTPKIWEPSVTLHLMWLNNTHEPRVEQVIDSDSLHICKINKISKATHYLNKTPLKQEPITANLIQSQAIRTYFAEFHFNIFVLSPPRSQNWVFLSPEFCMRISFPISDQSTSNLPHLISLFRIFKCQQHRNGFRCNLVLAAYTKILLGEFNLYPHRTISHAVKWHKK